MIRSMAPSRENITLNNVEESQLMRRRNKTRKSRSSSRGRSGSNYSSSSGSNYSGSSSSNYSGSNYSGSSSSNYIRSNYSSSHYSGSSGSNYSGSHYSGSSSSSSDCSGISSDDSGNFDIPNIRNPETPEEQREFMQELYKLQRIIPSYSPDEKEPELELLLRRTISRITDLRKQLDEHDSGDRIIRNNNTSYVNYNMMGSLNYSNSYSSQALKSGKAPGMDRSTGQGFGAPHFGQDQSNFRFPERVFQYPEIEFELERIHRK